jgi:murein DD-endopeptidase MepM/ murein hydrolase activator NlpD
MNRYYIKQTGFFHLSVPSLAILSIFGVALFSGSFFVVGYGLGSDRAAEQLTQQMSEQEVDVTLSLMQAWISAEQLELAETRKATENQLDALAMRLARMQAEMMRVDALGERLVAMAELDSDEFDFSAPPAVGGADASSEQSQSASEFMASLEALNLMMDERSVKLSALEDWLMHNEVRARTSPSGLPVEGGWISSDFGPRIHPITGKFQKHKGIDFPGKQGQDVVAVAAGVVTRSEVAGGYGNLVEIRHSGGFSTRYAHNKKNIVQEGDVVEKGQTIALLGSTGRSTGPHVHFEVRKDGEPVNPKDFIQVAKSQN